MPNQKKIIILGAGISGLSLAWFLKQKYGTTACITLLEATDRVGGWIRSVEQEGFLFETGPHSLRTGGEGIATLALAHQLGLEDDLVLSSPAAKRRYLYLQGRLQQVPSLAIGKELLAALWREGKCMTAAKLLFGKKRFPDTDVSIDAFFREQIGEWATDSLVNALISGIYAGDTKTLSVSSCLPSLFKRGQYQKVSARILNEKDKIYHRALRGHRRERFNSPSVDSVVDFHYKSTNPSNLTSSQSIGYTLSGTAADPFIKRMQSQPLFSFRCGLETLTKRLAQKLSSEILLGQRVTAIRRHTDHIEVEAGDETWKCDVLYSALPARQLAPLIADRSPSAASLLASIPYASLAVVNLGYAEEGLGPPGFGYLIPQKEKQPILGCLCHGTALPDQLSRGSRFTVMLGGAYHPKVVHQSSESLVDIAVHTISRHLDISQSPRVTAVHVAHEAIPQYLVGHKEKIDRLEQLLEDQIPGLTVLGSSYRSLGVNGCIAEALEFSTR